MLTITSPLCAVEMLLGCPFIEKRGSAFVLLLSNTFTHSIQVVSLSLFDLLSLSLDANLSNLALHGYMLFFCWRPRSFCHQ